MVSSDLHSTEQGPRTPAAQAGTRIDDHRYEDAETPDDAETQARIASLEATVCAEGTRIGSLERSLAQAYDHMNWQQEQIQDIQERLRATALTLAPGAAGIEAAMPRKRKAVHAPRDDTHMTNTDEDTHFNPSERHIREPKILAQGDETPSKPPRPTSGTAVAQPRGEVPKPKMRTNYRWLTTSNSHRYLGSIGLQVPFQRTKIDEVPEWGTPHSHAQGTLDR